ncbi:tetratricopeptide repeat protein [Sphingomonas oleivorans]|nr:tetratricopeptide repeat protein [Sphingomonas oleivorans]
MGFAIILIMALAVFVAVAKFARPPRAALELLGAALMIGLAGYAWQGSPTLAGRPTPPRAGIGQPDSIFAQERGLFMERMGRNAQVLETAEAFQRQGLPDYAVGVIRGAIGRNPKSAELWVGLGNALLVYGDGMVTPAAKLAFDRAAAIDPDHPAPPYFLGLAYAQNGQLDRAAAMWRSLLQRTPADAPFRGDVALKLAIAERLLALQQP